MANYSDSILKIMGDKESVKEFVCLLFGIPIDGQGDDVSEIDKAFYAWLHEAIENPECPGCPSDICEKISLSREFDKMLNDHHEQFFIWWIDGFEGGIWIESRSRWGVPISLCEWGALRFPTLTIVLDCWSFDGGSAWLNVYRRGKVGYYEYDENNVDGWMYGDREDPGPTHLVYEEKIEQRTENDKDKNLENTEVRDDKKMTYDIKQAAHYMDESVFAPYEIHGNENDGSTKVFYVPAFLLNK